jgi:hypothetical protein
MAKAATQAKPSFGSILDEPAQDAERPPNLPRGHYHTSVASFREDKSSQKGTEFIEYGLKIVEPLDDVDEEELEEFGDTRNHVIPVRFYLTEKSKYRLKEFLEHCGVDLSDGKSFKQAIPEAVNCEIVAQVIHEPLQSGEGVMARVRNTSPVKD